MLVLSRKIGEKLMIGEDIEVTVKQITPTRVAIGINAPASVKVLRGEVKERDEAEGDPCSGK